MEIPLTPMERDLLARAKAGTLPRARSERQQRAINVLICTGHLTAAQTNPTPTPRRTR